MGRDLAAQLRRTRIGDLARLTRRLAGLRYLSAEDFTPVLTADQATRMAEMSARARGDGPAPILILGVMPRSGTNYLRDLLDSHPDVLADPGQVHEFPLLQAGRGAGAFMQEYLDLFPANREVSRPWDALALLAGAWLRHFQVEAGARRVLLKSPHVQNLSLAPHLFPGARIILCLRDGRDVVDSSLRTFSRRSLSRKTFGQMAHEWHLSTQAVLSHGPGGAQAHPDVMIIRYEDAVSDPRAAVDRMLEHTDLVPTRYDFEQIERLPVRGSSRSQAQGGARWHPQEKAGDFNPVRRWESWDTRRKARFDRIAGDMLEAAGYER